VDNDEVIQPESKPEEGSGIEQKTIHIPFPETYIYSNCAAFSLSLMEFRIGFAEAITGQDKVFPRVGITMTPEAAAVIALTLVQQLTHYEKNFGEIRHPAWRDAKTKLRAANLPTPSQ
jgi:hypothetical protein